MSERLRVLYIPSGASYGPYRSLARFEETTRRALSATTDLLEVEPHPASDPQGFLAALEAARPFDAVLDLSDQLIHAPVTRDVPSAVFSLGSMTNGATLPWLRRTRLKTTDAILMSCASDLVIYERVLAGTGPAGVLVPFGIDTAFFRPRGDSARLATRALHGLDPDDVVLVYAGRVNVQKNLHSTLLALRELAAGGKRFRLVLAGPFDDVSHLLFGASNAGYEEYLRGLVRRWGLEERVRFVGSLDDEGLASLLSASDVLVTLSLHNNENFGYAAVEAMACGIPVVAAHFGGLKDTVVHGVTGYHVETLMTDNGLRAAWRQAIAPLEALATRPDLRARLGAAARERATAEYSLEAYGRRLENGLREAVLRCRRDAGRPGTSFRFSPPAMDLHLRNLRRTLARADGEAPRDRTGPKVEYPTYRFFQGPYATRDAASVGLLDTDVLTRLTRCQLDRESGCLQSLDPIWPATYHLEPAELGTVAALEPGVTRAEVVARGEALGLTRARVEGLLERLLRAGVLYVDRPFRGD